MRMVAFSIVPGTASLVAFPSQFLLGCSPHHVKLADLLEPTLTERSSPWRPTKAGDPSPEHRLMVGFKSVAAPGQATKSNMHAEALKP